MRRLAAVGALLWVASASAQTAGLWESRTLLPFALGEVSAASIGDQVYLACGVTADGLRSNRLLVYDLAADAWAERAPLPFDLGVDHCNLAAADNKLYFLGGIRLGRGFLTDRTLEYDPALDRWTQISRMGVPRGASGVAVIDSKIYVAGGQAAQQSGRAFAAFDVVDKRWEKLPDLPGTRTRLTAQTAGGMFYAIGGSSGGAGGVRSEVFEYDPASRQWRERARMPTPRSGLASGVIDGRIVVFGGQGPGEVYAQVEEYDPAANQWRTLAPMPTPRHGFYGVSIRRDGSGEILLAGGAPAAGLSVSPANEAFFFAAAVAPAFSAQTVVDAASFRPLLAPGSLASLFGTDLAAVSETASTVPLPRRLAAAELLIDGTPAPLLFVGREQINFQVPFEAPFSVELSVVHRGASGEAVRLNLAIAAPAVFTLDQSGGGQAAVLISGTGLVAGPRTQSGRRPAAPGEALEIYCTGLGAVSLAPAAGDPSPVAPPLARTLLRPTVRIGGVEAVLLYSGLAPGFVGVNQVNVTVADSTPSGDAVSLEMFIGDASSNLTTIALE